MTNSTGDSVQKRGEMMRRGQVMRRGETKRLGIPIIGGGGRLPINIGKNKTRDIQSTQNDELNTAVFMINAFTGGLINTSTIRPTQSPAALVVKRQPPSVVFVGQSISVDVVALAPGGNYITKTPLRVRREKR